MASAKRKVNTLPCLALGCVHAVFCSGTARSCVIPPPPTCHLIELPTQGRCDECGRANVTTWSDSDGWFCFACWRQFYGEAPNAGSSAKTQGNAHSVHQRLGSALESYNSAGCSLTFYLDCVFARLPVPFASHHGVPHCGVVGAGSPCALERKTAATTCAPGSAILAPTATSTTQR